MSNKCASVPEEYAGNRLDICVAKMFPEYSRTRLKSWIKSGLVLVNDKKLRPRDLLAGGESIKLVKPTLTEDELPWQAEDISLDIVDEDEDVLIINKPAGLVVHPGAGNWTGTLVNGLLHYDKSLFAIPRAGIVHRLDKDTTGLLVVARNLTAHTSLVRQLEKRTVKREYQALIKGVLTAGATIDEPIGRHKTHRTKMAVVKEHESGREAITHYRLMERFRSHTLVRVMLDTGRTHQIRVHMAYRKMPLLGDKIYGGRFGLPKNASGDFKSTLASFNRQALHAFRLGFDHPKSGKYIQWQIDLPQDMQGLVLALRKDINEHI